MSSPSDRVYTMEQLLQFDSRSQSTSASGSSAASTTSNSPTRLSGFTGMNMNMGISPVALSTLRSLFPEIVPEDNADQSNNNDSNMNVEYQEDEEEEDGWVYGDVVLRGDLPEQLVERLRQAVHDALSPPRALLTSPITSTTATSFTSFERSKPLSHRAKPSDLSPSWRSNGHLSSVSTMGPNTRTRQHSSPPLSSNPSYSYHDRHSFGVNLFNKANALHPPQKTGADSSDNWRKPSPRESLVTSWRNTNVKWNESTSSYVPVRV